MSSVRFDKVTKQFGATRAVEDVSLMVEHGEIFFLLGPSGCGKTTLLRMLAGFLEPDRGSIQIADRDVTRVRPEQRGVAMVFQSYALWPHMSVMDNVAFGLSVRKTPADETVRRVAETLRSVHMEGFENRKPAELSGGQQQRTALARALVVNPTVLLLDEPLSNLDAKLRIETRQEIRRLCKSAGITAVYVTHDQKEAMSIGDRMAVMRDGRVLQVDTPRSIFERPVDRFVADFLGESNFIPGSVADIKNSAVQVETPLGILISTVDPPALSRGARVTVLIRPSGITMTEMKSAGRSNEIPGQVESSTYLGEVSQFVVRSATGNTILKVDVLNAPSLPTGEQVRMWINPSAVVLLPAD